MSKKLEDKFNTSSTCWYFPAQKDKLEEIACTIAKKEHELRRMFYERDLCNENIIQFNFFILDLSILRNSIEDGWFSKNKRKVSKLISSTQEKLYEEEGKRESWDRKISLIGTELNVLRELQDALKSIKPYPYNVDKGVGRA